VAALRLVDGRPIAFGAFAGAAGGSIDVAAAGATRLRWPASPLPGAQVTALAARGDEIWAGTFDRGLARFAATGAPRGGFDTGEAYGLDQVNAVDARVERGDLVVATARGALVVDARGTLRRVLPKDGLGGEQVAATATRGPRVAYATNRGVTVIDERAGGARTLNATFGLANHHATCVAWDAQERLWVGTLGGLSIVAPAFVVERNVVAGPAALGAAWITALAAAPGQSGMYVGTYGGGVALVTADGKVDRLGGPWTRRPVRVNPGALLVHEGTLLAGTLDDGLLAYDVATRRWSSAHAPLGTRNVTALLWTADALWIGTDGGLVRIARAQEVLS
jgi:ligand-binding sensor domain-containing protein